MGFLISDTFTASLAKLTGDEQKAVKTTAFDLQLNPESPGLQFHRLLRAKDPHFWSVRVNLDIRLIVHKTATSLLLCYVDHHDAAYRWAEQGRLRRRRQSRSRFKHGRGSPESLRRPRRRRVARVWRAS